MNHGVRKKTELMKNLMYILAFIVFISCGQIDKKEGKFQIDEKAKQLNDSAIGLANTFDNNKILEAIKLFDQATKIQPNYYVAYWNKMVYQNQLGLANDAFETLKKLEELRPKNPDLKVTAGIFMETNFDSIKAREKFIEAEKIYKSILDTLNSTTDTFQTILINRAVNLKFLGRENEANGILMAIKQKQKDESLKEFMNSFIKMGRKELLNNFKTTKQKEAKSIID
jgi:tetratricopeptide (TPR) repeat protein